MSTRVVGPPDTWWTEVEVEGWLYVFVPTTGRLLELNTTAARVWRRCDGSLTRDGLVDALVAEHGGQWAEVRAVVDEALVMLLESGLLLDEEGSRAARSSADEPPASLRLPS